MISAIVCVDKNWGIGSNGNLLVRIPEDMKFFKEKTIGNAVVMGRKTWESLPSALPNRENFVISSKLCNLEGAYVTGMNVVKYALKQICNHHWMPKKDIFIIGGGKVYEELLPYCDRVYVTKVLHCYDNADAYFPNIDDMPEWEMVSASEIKKYNNIEYQFCEYRERRFEQ